MDITCGPINDQRKFKLELPFVPNTTQPLHFLYKKTHKLINNDTIGVLISGGIDSAILYYTLLKENLESGNKFKIIPYTILRKEGSRYYAKNVINYIHKQFNLPEINLNIIGDNTLPEIKQVESGIADILYKQVDYVYLGLIENRKEHLVGWHRFKFTETFHLRYPLLNLQKSHVIDLYVKLNQLNLLKLTYSCAINEIDACGTCNGCLERSWGLNQLNLIL